MKLQIKPGQESELCHMIIDCCAQQRTYEKFFGLMGQRFCQVCASMSSFLYRYQIMQHLHIATTVPTQVTRTYAEPFQNIFVDTYNTVHR